MLFTNHRKHWLGEIGRYGSSSVGDFNIDNDDEGATGDPSDASFERWTGSSRGGSLKCCPEATEFATTKTAIRVDSRRNIEVLCANRYDASPCSRCFASDPF